MKRVAIILHADDSVAPVDDTANHFDKVELYEADENNDKHVDLPIDPHAEDFVLGKALSNFEVTHVIGQHFEEGCFNNLRKRGIHMWLEAPDLTAKDAIAAWKEGKLPEAVVGTRAVQSADGMRNRDEGEHRPRRGHGSSDVKSPIHGPEI